VAVSIASIRHNGKRTLTTCAGISLSRKHFTAMANCTCCSVRVPAEVRDVVAPFPERHFSLVSFCARCPGALDLIHSTPALAMILANCWCFGKKVQRPLRSARMLLKKTQREQLAWLGFVQPGKSVVRILRKVPPTFCTVELLLYLRNALNYEEARKRMEHLERINRGVVLLLSDERLLQHVTDRFLSEVASCGQENRRAHVGYEMRRWLELTNPNRGVPDAQFNSIHDFQQNYAHALEADRLAEMSVLRFPKPPVPGTREITPIETPLELLEEGEAQHHCIASYAETIARGWGYAYRIAVFGERATLFIEPTHRNKRKWTIAECRGFANRKVPSNIMTILLDWLNAAQMDKSVETIDPFQMDLFDF